MVPLRKLLEAEDWPLAAKRVLEAGSEKGIAERTMQATATRMGIWSEKGDFDGGWLWHRPEDASKVRSAP